MIKLTKGQKWVLIATAVPMSAIGTGGAVGSFVSFNKVLKVKEVALALVAAGEGATLICALVTLALTLLGQQTPGVVRAGLWLIPITASAVGVLMAPNLNMKLAMGFTPLAMTAAGEGVALVARRIVAFQTGTDLEQQRRSGLLLWHANRAANGRGIGRTMSKMAVGRLTKQFAATDDQMSVQLSGVQRYRISEGADANLARVLSGTGGDKAKKTKSTPAIEPVKAEKTPELPSEAPVEPAAHQLPAATSEPLRKSFTTDGDDGYDFVRGVLAEAQDRVATDSAVKLMTVAEVAAVKGVAPGTVRSWVNRGKLAVAERDDDGRSLFHPLAVADLD